MTKAALAIFFTMAAIFVRGLDDSSYGELLLLLLSLLAFVYRAFGGRPSLLSFAPIFGAYLAGFGFLWCYVVVPIQYYYSLWGWFGALVGVIAAPFEVGLFPAIALLKGGSALYVARFISGILSGIAGIFLFHCAHNIPLRQLLVRRG